MSTRRSLVPVLFIFFLPILIGSCSPRPAANATPTELTGEPAGATATALPSESALPETQAATTLPPAQPTGSPAASPAPTQTTSIGDWRDAPVMPEISQHVLEIYRQGQAQGRDPHAFSVIGDCQAVPVVFLGDYELGKLTPGVGDEYLWDIIHYFKGSYARWGMAVRGGFTAASVLSPLQADPKYCKSGETPLTCEYRVHNPAYVFITLETWLEPKTVNRYDGYLRSILDYVIAHGSVPILLTKADSSEMRNGTHVFNPVIVQAAHDYDVPVVNFWRAAQSLDNSGIDRTREGFHLSPDGYKLKNTLAMRALYKVWKVIQSGDTSAALPGEATPTAAASPTPEPQAAPQVTAPACEGGCIFFGVAGSQDGVVKMQGVYAYSVQTKTKTQVLGEGWNLQDASVDGKRLLVNHENHLYEASLADGSSNLLSDSFNYLGKQGAYWNSDDTQVIFLDQNQPLQGGTGTAFTFFPSSRDGERYFESGNCASEGFCQSTGVYRLGADGSSTLMEPVLNPVIAPDGKLMAFLNPAAATDLNWYHINYVLLEDLDRGIGSRRIFYLPDDHIWMRYPDVRSMAFSPDSSKLFILDDVYSEYFENSLRLESYLVDLNSGILYSYGKITGTYGSFKPQVVWSPQGDRLLFFLTTQTGDNQYQLGVYETTLNTEERMAPYEADLLDSSEYFYITNIYWR